MNGLERVVYISGIHGCGKSTLRKALEKNHAFLLHDRPGHVAFDEPYFRQLWRIVRYQIEVEDQKKWARNNPNKIIIGDRCFLDAVMYNKAFLLNGWLAQSEFDRLTRVCRSLFVNEDPGRAFDMNEDHPKFVVYLDQPLPFVKKNIVTRWEIEGKKWREGDFEYLRVLDGLYRDFYDHYPGHVLRVTTTNRETQVNAIIAWLKEFKHFQEILK